MFEYQPYDSTWIIFGVLALLIFGLIVFWLTKPNNNQKQGLLSKMRGSFENDPAILVVFFVLMLVPVAVEGLVSIKSQTEANMRNVESFFSSQYEGEFTLVLDDEQQKDKWTKNKDILSAADLSKYNVEVVFPDGKFIFELETDSTGTPVIGEAISGFLESDVPEFVRK